MSQIEKALEAYEAAFEKMFGQCCSNPIKDAWDKPVDMSLLNEAHRLAKEALQECRAAKHADANRHSSQAEVLASIPRTDDLMKDGNVAAIIDDLQHAWVGKKYRQAFYNDMTRLVEAAALAGGYDAKSTERIIARLGQKISTLVRDNATLTTTNDKFREEFVKHGAYFVVAPDTEAKLIWQNDEAADSYKNLDPKTANLVRRFASALAKKLRLAEIKYGYTDGWAREGWEEECCNHLYQHLDKGDPLDVAAYCAFMWHHRWTTYRPLQEKIASKPIYFQYINWRGETSHRAVLSESIWFGSTDYHKQPQWLMSGTDLDTGHRRDFAMRDMHCVAGQSVFKPA